MTNERIRTQGNTISLGDDGILRSMNAPGAKITLADAEADIAAGLRLAGGRRVPLLVVATQMRSITREARHYYASEAASELVAAQAIVVGSSTSRVIGNFFLGLNKPPYPTRLFAHEADALEWLRGFLA